MLVERTLGVRPCVRNMEFLTELQEQILCHDTEIYNYVLWRRLNLNGGKIAIPIVQLYKYIIGGTRKR